MRFSRFRWFGDGEPVLGHYMLSESGEDGYEIVGIEETARSGVGNDPRVYRLECRKVEPDTIDPDRLLGLLAWDKR